MPEGAKKLRADTQRTRDRLLDVLGELLEKQGLDVSLPDLAREAGVATATVYRHFDDVHELRQEFYRRVVDTLLAEVATLNASYQGRELFDRACESGVRVASTWARAATFIRSAEGYLERVHEGDVFVGRIDGVLRPILAQLIDDGVIPDQDLDYAVLIWITLFDERVLVDLESTLGWSLERVARTLSVTVLAALGATS
ncbi:TetR family transcriptional regulator [soil metagenome]